MWTENSKPNLSGYPSVEGRFTLTRRQMLQRTCVGFGMLSLASLLKPLAGSFQSLPTTELRNQLSREFGQDFEIGATRHYLVLAPRGKASDYAAVFDTFDPKPALKKYEGQQPSGELYKKNKGSGFMPSPLQFAKRGKSGIEISETLPNLGRIIDDCCIIRSMKTDVPNHEPALLQMHTGNVQPIRPSLGSWLLYGLGTENENLPGYVVLRPSPKIVVGPALWSNSFLPAENQATSIITSDMQVDKLIANIKNPKLTRTEQREQLDLLNKLNQVHLQNRNGDAELEGQIKSMETAFHMQSEAMKTFDISKEPASVREMYGETPFARSCLLARRLVERGVRMVQIYCGAGSQWDAHSDIEGNHTRLCTRCDQPTAPRSSPFKSCQRSRPALVACACARHIPVG